MTTQQQPKDLQCTAPIEYIHDERAKPANQCMHLNNAKRRATPVAWTYSRLRAAYAPPNRCQVHCAPRTRHAGQTTEIPTALGLPRAPDAVHFG